ncbi:MAG: metallopeptidase [Eubacterium sp.]|nr:metallopeptidase [Eubacterium sp.]
MTQPLTQTQWEQNMCEKILGLVRNELYLDLRYLSSALSALSFTPDASLQVMAVDGIRLFYSAEQTLRLFRSNPKYLNRSYLHSVLHCIFRHLWIRGEREPVIWNLACDISVEWTIDSLESPSVKRILSLTRINYYEHLKKEGIPVSAAAIYRDLLSVDDPDEQMKLQLEFVTDDHRYWPADPRSSPEAAKAGEAWERTGRRISQELELRGKEDSDAISCLKTQVRQGMSRRSYRDFLRKFTVLKEELHCDYDEFDMNYYSYGLRLYKNMPLIEPLESREVMKISEFVIVIDTSYSTSGDLVRRFLEETFHIIARRDSFFHKSHIRILQCDNRVQSDQIIREESDLKKLLNSFTLLGGGGTDFRPAFSYVDKLLADGIFQNLKGLLYFTDGKGIYPRKRPSYDTAFIFFGREDHPDVPSWAMKLKLEEEDLHEH